MAKGVHPGMIGSTVGHSKYELDTPALLVDLGRMERNIGRMTDVFRSAGINWRPHTKLESTEGRREDSGRGWVRELQGRWPGVGVDGRAAEGLQSPHRAPKALCGSCVRGMARRYAAGDSRDRGGARLRGR